MKEKLHNRRGATILMALLLLLVATVVSVVVITVALTSAKVTDNAQAAQQAYLTVSSAAELFRDELAAGTGYKKTYTVTYTYDADLKQYSNPTVSGPETSFDAGCFSELLKAAADDVTDSSGAEKTANISVDGLADVTVTLKMDADYNITAVFTLAQQDSKDPDPNYRITVEVPFQGETKGSCPNFNDTSTCTYSDTIQWGTAEFTKGAAE